MALSNIDVVYGEVDIVYHCNYGPVITITEFETAAQDIGNAGNLIYFYEWLALRIWLHGKPHSRDA